jgi:hypothetical protein
MLAKRWREHEDPKRPTAGHEPPAPRGQDRHGLSRLWPADRRSHFRRQCRPDAGGEEVRARTSGFRLATYAMWWIRAAIQEYILRSWSLVKIGTTAAQKKLFFNLRKAEGPDQALEEGDLHPSRWPRSPPLGVPEDEVVSMNRAWRSAATPRSTRRCAKTATASGRTGWSTTRPIQDEIAPTRGDATRSPRAKLLTEAMDSRSTSASAHPDAARRLKDEPDDAGGPVAAVQ